MTFVYSENKRKKKKFSRYTWELIESINRDSLILFILENYLYYIISDYQFFFPLVLFYFMFVAKKKSIIAQLLEKVINLSIIFDPMLENFVEIYTNETR